MPNVVRKDIDNTSAQITVTVTREEIQPKYDAELKRFQKRAALKGFRQGHAPIGFIKKLYGSSILLDTFNDVMSQEIYDYLRESGLNVLGQPLPAEDQPSMSFKPDALDPEYTVVYDVGFVPDFPLKGMDKNSRFECLVVSNLDELAAEDLEYSRNRMGERTQPENDIQENDIIKIDGRETDGDYSTIFSTLVKNIPDESLRNTILGKKKGDSLSFNARLLDDYKDEKMYRKYILSLPDDDERVVGDQFDGVIVEVSRLEKAPLDQAFFDKYFGEGKVSTEEEAVEILKDGIRQYYQTRADALLMRDFQQHLIESNPVELPEAFLKRWLLISNNDKENSLSAQDIEAGYPGFANNLRWTMIRDKIKADHQITVDNEDIKAEFRRRLKSYFQADLPDHVMDGAVERMMAEAKNMEETVEQIEMDKIFAVVRDAVTITEKPVHSEEFHQILESAQAPAAQQDPGAAQIDADIVE